MCRSVLQSLSLVFILGFSCRADLTIRYTTAMKMGGGMPPAVTDAIGKQMAAQLPKESVIRIKGDKTVSNAGLLTVVIDNTRAEITLLDPAKKQYVRIPLADYAAAVQAAMPVPSGNAQQVAAAQQAMKNFKFDVQNSKTGQMAMVYGIRAEEHLMTLTMSMNMPGAAAGSIPLGHGEIHTWIASPDDLTRIPGLREYAGYAQRALDVLSPTSGTQKIFDQMPGMSDMMQGLMANGATGLMVKMDEKMYVSMPGADQKTPMMEMEMHLAGISSDTIDDSVFEVPADYQMATSAEVLKALIPAPATPPEPAAQRLPDLAPGEPITRVGGGVRAPSVIFKPEPEYTKEASAAKLSGSVQLSLVVDKQGTPRNIQVVRRLGMGLDEKAVDAVSQWKFQPGQKDGQPVNVRATVEVNFKLLSDPPQQ